MLDLTYLPSNDTQPDATSWYLPVRRQGTAPPVPYSPRRSLDASLPTSFALLPSQPNPARGTTVIGFELPVAQSVRLEVFDLLGRRVATLADGPHPAGSHAIEWDLRDPTGARARPGVYVYRMAAGEFRAREKMSVLR